MEEKWGYEETIYFPGKSTGAGWQQLIQDLNVKETNSTRLSGHEKRFPAFWFGQLGKWWYFCWGEKHKRKDRIGSTKKGSARDKLLWRCLRDMGMTGLGWRWDAAAPEAIRADLARKLPNTCPEGRDFHIWGDSGTPETVCTKMPKRGA